MNQLIPIINQLQDVFNTVGIKKIDLPQIVVVGSQSAGKSSVLESIVGKDFLPRGSGMVTKRPLILQLVNLPPNETKEWGEFAHKPGTIFTNFEEIKKEIETETLRLTGTKKTISPVAIRLKIYSPNVVDLTLVDLPGLTTISVGDQEKDISQQLRQMVLKFIESPNAIILAVSAANIDLATSDALSIAREVDPEGERTIGVITKMDIMDRGTDAMEVLYGRVYNLRYGYIGVLNRSQEDINNNVPINIALKKEKEWFYQHPIYSKISDRLGVAFLSKTLNIILIEHIMKTLPSLKITITEMLNKTKIEYDQFVDEFERKDIVLLDKILEFCSNFYKVINGEYINFDKHELIGGAKLFDVFEKVYRPVIDRLDLINEISDTDIKTAINNAQGTQPNLFLPHSAFELLVKQQICRFSESSHKCVDDIKKELSNIFSFVASETVMRYSYLKDAIVIEADKVLEKNMSKTHEMVQNIIDIEQSYINTVHPDFDATDIIFKAEVPQKNIIKQDKQNNNQLPQQQDKPINNQIVQQQNKQNQQPNQQKNIVQNKPKVPQKTGFFSFFSPKEVEIDNFDFDDQIHQPIQQINQQPPQTFNSTIEVNPVDTREQREIRMMRNLTKAYLEIIRKSIQDFVPKSIMHFMVKKTTKDIQNELIESLYKSEKVNDLMSESNAVATKREMLKKNYETLKTALNILEGVSLPKI